jgi:hypothetical protein
MSFFRRLMCIKRVPLEAGRRPVRHQLVCFAVPTSRVELVGKAVRARHLADSFISRRRCARSTNSCPGPGSSAARLDSEPSRGAEAAHPEGDGALAACVAAGHAGAASRAPWLLLTVVVTLGCPRVNDVARLQVCYLWFIYLMSYCVPGSTVRRLLAWRPGMPAPHRARRGCC